MGKLHERRDNRHNQNESVRPGPPTRTSASDFHTVFMLSRYLRALLYGSHATLAFVPNTLHDTKHYKVAAIILARLGPEKA